jgi:2-hydroxy-3-oxopropionate reductase
MPSEVVGFIGLGIMGRPMALNLIKAGYKLVVTSRSQGPIDALSAAGAKAVKTPSDVAREADVVVTMVPDTPDVEKVIRGKDGVLDGLKRGAIVIDMSTISPDVTRQLAEAIAAKGGSMLDCPVSGGEVGAKNATLTIMGGGDEKTFERARPILSCMGKPESVTYIGPSGSGQVTKLCNQICIAANLAGVAEAYALATANGLEPARVRQALLGGFAASKVMEFHGNRMITKDYKPGFFVRLFQKDLRLAVEANMASGVTMPVTSVVTQFVNAYVAAGGGELDCAAAAEVWFAASEGKPVKTTLG